MTGDDIAPPFSVCIPISCFTFFNGAPSGSRCPRQTPRPRRATRLRCRSRAAPATRRASEASLVVDETRTRAVSTSERERSRVAEAEPPGHARALARQQQQVAPERLEIRIALLRVGVIAFSIRRTRASEGRPSCVASWLDSGRYSACRMRRTDSAAPSATKGFAPTAHSYMTTPSEYWSDSAVTSPPLAASGER